MSTTPSATQQLSWPIRLVIALFACLLAFFIEWQRPELTTRLDEGIRDLHLKMKADPTPDDRIAVIDIDEESLRQLGPWPWPRSRVASLLEILFTTYGARAIGVDIVFPEAADPSGDIRLSALAQHAPLTLAQIFDYTSRSPNLRLGHLAGGLPASATNAMTAHGYIANHQGLSQAHCIGNIGYTPDPDGVLRRIPGITRYQERDYPHFALALAQCAGNTNAAPNATAWRIPYTRAQNAYTVVSAHEILRQTLPPAALQGRYILVGSSSLSLGDRVSTPLEPLTAGIMVHAASLTALLDRQNAIEPTPWSGRPLLILWITLSIGLFIRVVPKQPAWSSMLLLTGLGTTWTLLALWGIQRGAEWSITAPIAAYLLLLATAIPHEWWQTQRRNKRLLNTFAHYVAQPVLEEILRRGLIYSLDPTLKEVTVLIADMEGYTRSTSSLSLEEAAQLTRGFLDCLTRPVLAHGGTLDKYSGDGLVAFWGAPLPCPDQADQAVSTAMEILAAVSAFNTARARSGYPPVRVRIGIESGKALVGDLGTSFRSTYTAVGDCINHASRLESSARELPADLVIGGRAASQIKNYSTYPLGSLTLRGTDTSIDIYSVEHQRSVPGNDHTVATLASSTTASNRDQN